MVTHQYEKLRLAAFGDQLLPESRHGLALFLRRGMLGWIRANRAHNSPRSRKCTHSGGSDLAHEHKDLIGVFAAMALTVKNRRKK